MKEVRVSNKTEPSKAASSLLYILEGGEDVSVSALGSSSEVLIKAVALVNNLSNLNVSYHPRLEYIKDNSGETRTAVIMELRLIR